MSTTRGDCENVASALRWAPPVCSPNSPSRRGPHSRGSCCRKENCATLRLYWRPLRGSPRLQSTHPRSCASMAISYCLIGLTFLTCISAPSHWDVGNCVRGFLDWLSQRPRSSPLRGNKDWCCSPMPLGFIGSLSSVPLPPGGGAGGPGRGGRGARRGGAAGAY